MDFQFLFTGATIEGVMRLATNISGRLKCILRLTLLLAIGFVLTAFGGICKAAATNELAAKAEKRYHLALGAWRAQPSNITNAIQVAHMAFDFAEFATRDEDRATIADRGISAAREVVRQDPHNAAGHYWLAMNLGQLARTKSLGALPLIKQIADEFFHARDLDEKFDYAGPPRALGQLYRDAPRWPTSVGDKKKAREYLLRAVALSPDFPENQLCLLESYEEWGERSNFERQFAVTERVIKAAKETLTGEHWEASWVDWDKRFQAMKNKASSVGRSAPPKGSR
jgi:tetratricopeptide (TPR) repeat protein